MPTGRIHIPLRNATNIELSLKDIENPVGQPLAVRVQLEVTVDGLSHSFDLGLAAPFPDDGPGVFLIP